MKSVRLDSIDATRWSEQIVTSLTDGAYKAKFALLRQLSEAEFIPDPSFDAAQRVGGRSFDRLEYPLRGCLFRECRLHLGAKVDAFAAEFFSIPCPERRRRLEALAAEVAPFTNLLDRLDQLRPALEISSNSLQCAPPKLAKTINDLASIFVRPRTEWPRRMNKLLDELHVEMMSRKSLNAAVQNSWPAFAPLFRQRGWRRADLSQLDRNARGGRPRKLAPQRAKRFPWLKVLLGVLCAVLVFTVALVTCNSRPTPAPSRLQNNYPPEYWKFVNEKPKEIGETSSWLARRFPRSDRVNPPLPTIKIPFPKPKD